MFAGLFLLCIGLAMVIGTVYGVRRGRVMTLIRSADQRDERFATPGESGFWLFAAAWFLGGAIVLYNAVRLMVAA